ncbi:MAG TPA: PH domain-containing protein [Syntrophales bacterium]|nr:PH domain-containing protein [Syntrophales bacterium]
MRTQLGKDEKVILLVKKHWITLTKPFFLIFIFIGVIIAAFKYPALASFKDVGLAGTLIAIGYFFYKYFEREVDIWAVTNTRVVDEWGIFTRSTKDSPLDRINNVSYKQPFAGLLLGYGNVEIQTAAKDGDTTITFVMQPKELKDAIVKAQKEFVEGNRKRDLLQADPSLDDTIMRDCPLCAERIKRKARICRFCGNTIEEVPLRMQGEVKKLL